MGTWGSGLYDNDAASDLRAAFAELVRLPLDEAALLDLTLQVAPAATDPADEDYPATWLAIADLFHVYGLHHHVVTETALRIAATGRDIELAHELGMEDVELRRRARVVERAAARWRGPHPRPRRRRVLKAPEPLLFEAGECLAYPTQGGNAANAHLTRARLRQEFHPDGWGCFVVLGAAHRYGYFASYLVVRLALRTVQRPTPADVVGSVISGYRTGLIGVPVDPAVKTVRVTQREVRELGLHPVATCQLDQGALHAQFPDRYALLDQPYWSLVGLLRPYDDRLTRWSEGPTAMKRLPWRRFIIAEEGCR